MNGRTKAAIKDAIDAFEAKGSGLGESLTKLQETIGTDASIDESLKDLMPILESLVAYSNKHPDMTRKALGTPEVDFDNTTQRFKRDGNVHSYNATEPSMQGPGYVDDTLEVKLSEEYERFEEWKADFDGHGFDFAIGMYTVLRFTEKLLSAADERQLERASAFLAAELVNYKEAMEAATVREVNPSAQDAAQGIQRTND